MVLLFFFFGIVTAAANKLPEFREIYYQVVGVPTWFFGVSLSIASAIAAIAVYFAHRLDNLSPRIFFMLDFVFLCLAAISVGLVSNPVAGVVLFTAMVVHYRVRKILAHSYFLRICPTQKLKATYLSVLAFFDAANGIWIPVALGYAVGFFGVQHGYLVFGVALLAALSAMYIPLQRNFTASAN